jgi:hypothetical protein
LTKVTRTEDDCSSISDEHFSVAVFHYVEVSIHSKKISMLTKPAILLRIEGITVLIVNLLLYRHAHADWALFAVLFLAPDLTFFGYLLSVRVGAALYNLAHTLITPCLVLAAWVITSQPKLLPLALIWAAHIGFDRLLGYGLKYPTRFNDTHLQHV